MKKRYIKLFSSIVIVLFSLQSFAANTITVTVKTTEKTATGIGYSVDGKEIGGPGKSYTGKGPKNKKYLFGYRKKAVDVSCGAYTLTKNSSVTLVSKGNKCHSVVK